VIFWLGYYALLLFVFSGREIPERAWRIGVIHILPQMIIAYANMEWLIPRFFIKKQYLQYFLGVFACFFALYAYYEWITPYFIHHFVPPPVNEGRPFRHLRDAPGIGKMFSRGMRFKLVYNYTQTLAIFFLSTAYKVFQIAQRREKEAALLRSENLQSELKFLKSQINPHFLFNALNNIYTLSIIKSDKAPDTILKLSDMLRYIIYDCNEERVPIGKELNYIRNYIALQKLKDENINIELQLEENNKALLIAPMILIPFIENSFKHSKIEDTAKGWIRLSMSTADNILKFQISNSLETGTYTKDRVGGVGLENVKRRLELSYPNRHELIISKDKNSFTVKLNILL
jgi:hypothetical protein